MKHSIEYDWKNDAQNLGYCVIRVGDSAIDASSYEINTSLRNDNLIAKVILQLANDLLKLTEN